MSAKLAADEICSLKCLVYFTLPRCQLQHIPKWEKMLHRPAASSCIVHRPPPLKRLNKELKKYESTALSSQPITLNMTNYETLRNPVEKLSSGEKKNWRRASGQTGSASKSALATAARNLLAADEICFSQYLVNIAAEPAPTWGKNLHRPPDSNTLLQSLCIDHRPPLQPY